MGGSNEVWFIPDQVDSIGASSPTARNNPLLLTCQDVGTLLAECPLIAKLFRPLNTTSSTDELYMKGRNLCSVVACFLISLVELLLFPLVIILCSAAPGIVALLVFAVVGILTWGIWAPLQGPDIIHCLPDETGNLGAARTDERWIFINGILVTGFSLKRNCDRLAQTFGREITGIHNRTYGLLGDLFECVVQRSFSYNTYDVRATYDYVKKSIVDQSVRRVVLIGHSQGGIVISMVLDMLLANMAGEDLAKIEVYTFGSAASHFNNPGRQRACLTPYSGVIRHIEHYVNGQDPVPRWGVLNHAHCLPQSRYAGKIFVRLHATGHMLNQHYISQMFPSPEEAHSQFLDRNVLVDAESGREECSSRLLGTCIPSGQDISDRPLVQSSMTVRELSRLWKYMGGKDPEENEDPERRMLTRN